MCNILSIHSAVFLLEYLPEKHLKTISCLLQFHERIEYKLLLHTYKVLTTSQPDYMYLHNLISVQSSGRTRSSSVVTLTPPPVSSSLQIINRSFRYASPHLWN